MMRWERQRSIKRILSLFIIITLLLSLISPKSMTIIRAEQSSDLDKQVNEEVEAPPFVPPVNSEELPIISDDLPSPIPKSKNISSKLELVEHRTEMEKVFQNEDGTFTKKIYTEPVHMKENEKWVELSPELKEDKQQTISTKKTKLKSHFKKEFGEEYATFESEGHTIRFSLNKAKGDKGEIKAKKGKASYNDNTIKYKGIFTGIDLRSTTFNKTVKEDIILSKYTGHHQFIFELHSDLQPILKDDGAIIFQDSNKKDIFVLPKPYMSDSNINQESGDAVTSQDVYYSLNQKRKNVYELTLTADPNWLQAPERVYPVYIDPSITIDYFDNAYVSSRYPTTNYSGDKLWDPGLNAYTLRVGYYDNTSGTNEALIKPDLSGLEFTNAIIHNANFHIFAKHHYYANNPNGVWLDENLAAWNPTWINWNNRPSSRNITSTNVGRNQWAIFNVTSTVQGWINGSKPNFGFKLHTAGNGQAYWKKFIAAENWTYAPYLEVTYSYPKPNKPRVSAYSNGSGSGTGYFDLSWDPTPGAIGYYVLIFNGYDYEYIPVGNVTNWSTKGKNIWPTPDEVAGGEFNLHFDGLGGEFALDPAPVYYNAYLAGSPYGDYSSSHRYWFRIVAEYPFDYSDFSDAEVPYIPLEQVKQPSGSAYTNVTGNSGYVSVKWDPVPGATGYKVWIFNGNEYEAFDVGNVNTWTTQNKNIWPTDSEISQGRYLLHHDNAGTELSLDPSPVYRNSGSTYYASHKNYWFRVTAYSNHGYPESIISKEFRPTFTETSMLGMKDYWTTIPIIGGNVTAFNGNFVMGETDFQLDGRGPGISINRTYNSHDSDNGLFGIGWYSSIEEKVKEEANGNILLTEADKGTILFTKTGDNQYQSPNGIYLEVKKTSAGFEIKDKDQSITTFSSDGRKQTEKDPYGNQVTYTYDASGKLTAIKDATGREFVLTYTGTHVTKITGPENRVVTYEYSGDYLIGSTTPRGKKYRYDYENGLLRYTYDPKHTDANPYKTTYSYLGNKLVQVTDPLGKNTAIAFNDSSREVTVTDPKGVKDVYTYTLAGNPFKTVVDEDGLKLTTTYEFEANNLTKKTYPKDQGQRISESYTYDGNGNVTSVTDTIGTETLQYNKNNDVIEATDAEGKSTTVTYNGTNAVSTTANDANQAGITSSVMQYDAMGNPTAGSDDLSMSTNLIRNPGFEDVVNSGNLTILRDGDDGTVSQDTTVRAPGGLGGMASLKIVSKARDTNWGFIAGTQQVLVDPDRTYTLSGWVKTENLKNSGVFFNIELLDGNGYSIANPWRDNRYSKLTGTNEWTERQLTFRTTAETRQVRIYMQVEHQNDANAGGTVWFDNMQLEEGVVSSSYNPVLNSSFEGDLDNWSLYSGTGTVDIAYSIDGGQSLKLVRTSTADLDIIPLQRLTINQSTAKPITITGMSKAEGVTFASSSGPNKDYAIVTNVIYQDGSVSVYEARFASGTHDWQRSAVTVPATKPIHRIDIHPLLRGEATGTVWYDAIRVIDGNRLTKQEYDSNGNYVTAIFDEENRKTSFTYDTYGNKKTETDSKNQTKSYVYNADNQLTKTILPNGTSVSYTYDDNSNVIEKLIENGTATPQKVTYAYDVDNKLTVFKDALQRNILHTYDANANPISTIMPNGSLLEWTYDSANRVISSKRNGVTAFTYQYDANGNETNVTDSVNGITRDKAYDVGNRIISMTDRGGSVAWTYHDKSYKLKEAKITHGAYTNTTSYLYNALNQNTEVTDGGLSYRFDYDEFGNVRTYTAGNGSGASFHYDQTQKVDQLTIGNKYGTTLLYETYQYDENGNRTIIDRKTGISSGKSTYVYDNINQLIKESLPDGTVNEFTYDGFGNRTRVKVTKSGSTISNTSATFNSGNQLVNFGSEVITYDENGNRLTDSQFKYRWNEEDQLVSVTKKDETTPFATYKYDDDGRRIEKNVNGQITRYHYDGDSINVLYETDAGGNVLRQYVYSVDGIRLAMKSQGQILYYHYNPHGDVIGISDQDGQTLAQYVYDAWGNIIQQNEQGLSVDNPFKYAGYMHDEETNMYYLMARYYHPTHGVFISVDPDPGDEDDPITQNGYTYTNNNPVMGVDPDGHAPWLAINAGFAIYDGYKAYKAGKSKTEIAGAVASSFVKIGHVKKAAKVLKITKSNLGRSGKQSRLKEIARDDKVSSALRGEIKRDINEIKKGKRSNIRVPQGYQLAHRRGFEASKGFGYKHSDLQIIKNHKTQHKHDNYGRKR